MQSMTGFGSASYKEKLLNLDISVKTINGRYLDIKIFGPRFYQMFESDIKELLRSNFCRGTVEVAINRRSLGKGEEVVFNELLAEKFLKGFGKVSKKLKLESHITSDTLLQVPDFFKIEESADAIKSEKELILNTLKKAIKGCDQERAREGKKLQKDLQNHIGNLSQVVSKIKKLRSSSLKELKLKTEQKLKKITLPQELDPARIAQEVVLLVEKADVAEELDRLDAHLQAVKKLLGSKGPIGKKLDFFAQELLREVNTVGSKSYSAALTAAVVEAKDLVEKYREQVQNIE
jgi:uncharacterized protein (TIGR00255 family)